MKCLLPFCKNYSYNHPKGVKFFQISKKRYTRWMKAIGRASEENPNYLRRICSEHFHPECFIQMGNKITIKNTALPTLKLRPSNRAVLINISPNIDADAEPSSCMIMENVSHGRIVYKRKMFPISSSDSEGFRRCPKQIIRDAKLDHNYSRLPKVMKHKLESSNERGNKYRQTLNSVKQRCTRLKRKVNHLKDVLKVLAKKDLLEKEALSVLQKSFSGIRVALMKRLLRNIRGKLNRGKFPIELRSFAMTLQFYSAKAYDYVRKTFHLALPSPSVIRTWLLGIEYNPGFLKNAFNSLKDKVDENKVKNCKTVCALLLDEMSLKKQIDCIGNKSWGYVDLGTGIVDDELTPATNALVLMVVALNGQWKIPIAYFLTNGLSGKEKANIVKQALIMLEEIDVTVVSVTCDGPSAHFTMASELGAITTLNNRLKPYFRHPSTNARVYIIFDACHMLKLMRNNWATMQTIFDSDGKEINFGLVKKLYDIQESELVRFGTKFKKVHIEWEKQKMKVNLAAQTLSSSVADAIEFLWKDIKHPEFKNAEATVQFIRYIDRLFDLCNSRNLYGRGFKTPLKPLNESYWKPILEKSIEYLKGLKDSNGRHLFQTEYKTPIKGFVITTLSLLGIYNDYVKPEGESLKYLLTYKLSQDHLELFFFAVRSNGCNNNPTCYQFNTTFRRLMLRHDLNISGRNCLQDNTSILTITKIVPSLRQEFTIDDLGMMKKFNLDHTENLPDHDYFEFPNLNLLSENVTYIWGLVVQKMKKIIKCDKCLLALETIYGNTQDDSSYMLIERKTRRGLIKPAKDLTIVLKYVEVQIRTFLNVTQNKLPNEKDFFDKFVYKCYIDFLLNGKDIFAQLDDHVFDICTFSENHKIVIIKLAIHIYSKLRFQSIAKQQTETERGALIRRVF